MCVCERERIVCLKITIKIGIEVIDKRSFYSYVNMLYFIISPFYNIINTAYIS